MNKPPHLSRLAYALALIGLALSKPAAAATGFDSLSFKPASDHGYYLTVEQSQTLKQWGYAIGLTGELSSQSLIIENAAGVKIQDVIRKQVSADLGAAVGLLDWLNLGVIVSGVPWQQFVTPGTLASDDGARMGDVTVNFKARLLNNEKVPVGIALVPFVTLPTGNEQHFVGNGKVTGGGLVVVDTKRLADRVSFSVNAGAQIRDSVTLSPGTSIDDQFLYGAGVNVAVAKPVQLIAEADGWTTFDDFFGEHSRNLELDGGIRILPGPKRNFQVTAGGGVGLLDGPGAPNWRVFTTVAYHHPRGEEAPPPPEPMPEVKEEVITTNKIHFAFNKYVIKPASYPVIQEILNGIQGRSDVEGVRVEGHTDSIGSDAYNQKLSEQRANSVRTFLIDHGYPSDKVTSVGMGEGSPIADNATKEGRAQNRRVEFHLQVRPGAKVRVKEEQTSSPTYEEGDPGNRVRNR